MATFFRSSASQFPSFSLFFLFLPLVLSFSKESGPKKAAAKEEKENKENAKQKENKKRLQRKNNENEKLFF